jgi:uncharacterized ion transporter superfamily protein YfcC
LIIVLIIITVLACFYFVYSGSYEDQIIAENSRQAATMGKSFSNSDFKNQVRRLRELRTTKAKNRASND